jgi:Holliday junction resolvase
MADTPEKLVKKKVVALLKVSGAYYFYPVMAGYGMSGIPDLIACYFGTFIAIECKAGKNKPTALQEQNLIRIAEAGGITLVVNEENVNEVKATLDKIEAIHNR